MRMKGFTLLEMIITLAIMGVAMMSVVKYKEKEANEAKRNIISNAIMSEVEGILKFVSDETVLVGSAGKEKEIVNPLYSVVINRPYTNRTKNKRLDDELSLNRDEVIDWGAGNSTRIHFTRKFCINTGTQGKYDFSKDYIPCNEPDVLQNSELKINRIDFVGKDTSIGSAIERVDFILDFDKTSADDTFAFTNYINSLEKSAEKYAIAIKEIYIVEQRSAGVDGWVLTKVGGQFVTLANLPQYLSQLDKNRKYGIRLSIDPNSGVFLRADGRIGTDKLCWNVASKMSGPCLTSDDTSNNLVLTKGSGATNNEPGLCWDLNTGTSKLCLTQNAGKDSNNNDASLLKLKDDTGNPATLLANVLVEETSMVDPGKKIYRTIPNTIYSAFGNSDERHLVITNPGSYTGNVTTEEGRIELNVQECPVTPDGIKLYPRLTAGVSSIVADTKDGAGKFNADFSQLSVNRNSGGNLGQLSGTAIQVNKSAGKWYITATVGVFNPIDNTALVYLNPRFLSVNITTWCSSENQN